MASFRNATTGAFTYEAMVLFSDDPDSLPVTGYQIISADNESPSARSFQFVLDHQATGAGTFRLEFENISGGEDASTLHSCDFEVLQNTWYHVAIAYNGAENTADNLKFYWTEVNAGK